MTQSVHTRKKEAERLASETLAQTLLGWKTLSIFRLMGELGLPLAVPEVASRHHRTTDAFSTDEKYSDMFPADRSKLAERGFFKAVATAMTVISVESFECALDAASLIFAQSLLDTAAFSWCRVCALTEPDDLFHLIDRKQFALSEIKEASFAELRDKAIDQYMGSLERESLVKKMDMIFAIC